MIVKFENNFHVPGFGRKRFPAGVVTDVPEKLRKLLPTSSEVLADDYSEDLSQAEKDDLVLADLDRAAGDTSKEVLVQAGFAGYASEDDAVPEEQDGWVFNDKAYKTESAMKAAETRYAKSSS
jgi:hypothetical protein|tara:strand:+ start:7206 stop:7574 length:369 start_codon:yes stop_codon:yes gene_type:complete